MTDDMISEVDRRLRTMSRGFGVEIVLAFPVVGGELELPVIASAGTYDRVRVSPERVFRYALRRGATGVVIGHNHPADTGPSEADRAVTRRLVSAGVVLGIPLLGHVVSEPGGWHELLGSTSQLRISGDAISPRCARTGASSPTPPARAAP